jgi:hypothetical protein
VKPKLFHYQLDQAKHAAYCYSTVEKDQE